LVEGDIDEYLQTADGAVVNTSDVHLI